MNTKPSGDTSPELDRSLNEKLLYSARNGYIDQVQKLLDQLKDGAGILDINCRGSSKSNKGWTPLHLASYFGHCAVVQRLVQHGADINIRNDIGDTPLHRAAFTGRTDCVTELLNNGADVNVRNSEGNTAKEVSLNPTIQALLEAAEKTDRSRIQEAYLQAAQIGSCTRIQELLHQSLPPPVNCADRFGNTALHLAASRGHYNIALLLLENGANPKVKNNAGKSALDKACDKKMENLLVLKPIGEVQKEATRHEGLLAKKTRLFGWRPYWVVLNKGVISLFRSRADATTGARRQGYKYLHNSHIECHRDNSRVFAVSFEDKTMFWLAVEDKGNTILARQRWVNSLSNHTAFATDMLYRSVNVSDEDDDTGNELLPLGSLQDAFQTSQAHQQLLQHRVQAVTESMKQVQQGRERLTEVCLINLQYELNAVLETSQQMTESLAHCLSVFVQQDQLRSNQLQREEDKNLILQKALDEVVSSSTLTKSKTDTAEALSHSLEHSTEMTNSDDEFYDCRDSGQEEDPDFTKGLPTAFKTMDIKRMNNLGSTMDQDNSNGSNNTVNDIVPTTSTVVPTTSTATSASNGALHSVRENGVVQQVSTGELSKWGGRTQLPSRMFSRKDFSVWTFLKQCIGKELSKITMPVVFNEPLSFLQRITEYMEYSHLLNLACDCDDPVSRLEYISAFAVSSSASNWERLGKPFNPLLGETYELTRDDLGFKVCCEQVSHHPPVSAFHVQSPNFCFHGTIYPKLKFWGKSVEVTPKGMLTLHLFKHNEVYTWQNVDCCVHNVIVGKLWIEHYGTMEINNQSSHHKAVINFKPCSWFGKDLHKIEGHLFDPNKKKVRAFYGKWIEALFCCDAKVYEDWQNSKQAVPNEEVTVKPSASSSSVASYESDVVLMDPPQGILPDDLPAVRCSSCDLKLPNQRCLWMAEARSLESAQFYNFTQFAMMLNELKPGQEKCLPPTDSRFRPDMKQMELGNLDGASDEKHRIEEKQRSKRKDRKKNTGDYAPLWFKESVNPHTGKEEWLFTHEYWNRNWDLCPDIF